MGLPAKALLDRTNGPLALRRVNSVAGISRTGLPRRGSLRIDASGKGKTVRVTEEQWRKQLVAGGPADSRILQSRSTSTGLLDSIEPETSTSAPSSGVWGAWDSLPARYKMLCAMSLSFVVCNMDKVNISVAILPMAQEYGWGPGTSGLVQASFFWGYMLSQVPGGYIASRIGGRSVLPGGVGLWSAATAAVPLLAGTIPGLLFSRAAVGLGEGVAPSAATDIVARTIDPAERSRAISFIFGGLHVGSLLGLLAAPPLIEAYGWQSVFYLFGGIGLAWVLLWEVLLQRLNDEDPTLSGRLRDPPPTDAGGKVMPRGHVPWRAIMRQRPFWALAWTHFVNNWFHYTMMAWLPTYFTDTLSLDLGAAARLSLLPPIAALAVASVAGVSADALVARGVPIPRVRKMAQALAFLGPAACLSAASYTPDGPYTVALISAALGLASFSLAGLYSNHADLSKQYAPLLLGLTNTAGAVPGIIGVAATGYVLDYTDNWALALFLPSIALFFSGTAVYTAWGRSEQMDLSDDRVFGWEQKLGLPRLYAALGRGKQE